MRGSVEYRREMGGEGNVGCRGGRVGRVERMETSQETGSRRENKMVEIRSEEAARGREAGGRNAGDCVRREEGRTLYGLAREGQVWCSKV